MCFSAVCSSRKETREGHLGPNPFSQIANFISFMGQAHDITWISHDYDITTTKFWINY